MNQKTKGFIKLQRSETTDELLEDPVAFHLLSIIAYRARFTDAPNLHGLRFGQALIGDCQKYGMTRSEYRAAKNRLSKWKLATFQGGPQGTIATLTDNRVFSLRDERGVRKSNHLHGHQHDHQFSEVDFGETTNEEPASDLPTATNTEGEKDKKGKHVCSPAGEHGLRALEDMEKDYPDIDCGMLATAHHQTEADLKAGKVICSPERYCIALARKCEADKYGEVVCGF
jgi:hypothetical protein